MDRLLRIFFAFLVVLGATGAELRLPQEAVQMDVDCGMGAGRPCPCGMPMPQPCNTSLPSPVGVPTRTVTAVVESVAAADQAVPEPRPWPATWALLPQLADEQGTRPEPLPIDTGPPLLASERAAQLRVFRL